MMVEMIGNEGEFEGEAGQYTVLKETKRSLSMESGSKVSKYTKEYIQFETNDEVVPQEEK